MVVAESADDVLTIQEAALVVRMHPGTVGRLCREGTIPSTKVGGAVRIRRGDLLPQRVRDKPGGEVHER